MAPKEQLATSWHYTRPAIALHWLLALLIAFMATLGWWMMTVEHEPGGERWFDLHKSIGLIVFVLVLVRFAWRLGHRPQPLPAEVPKWQVGLSHLTQWVLYLLMLAIPVTGILGSGYSRAGLLFFGNKLPFWGTPARATSHQLFEIHSLLIWVLVGFLALHVLGALKHLVMDKDEVFSRMWFGKRSPVTRR